ncbi:PTS glucose transporter subunit IIA [Halobacillus litoralis]|uniref:PTS sugar transporter subunit IIA n=1 Tax=Halobacillus litoralis TaxID=45668 RepID=UPI001CD3558E|nr:PTS glucose transporter subunit IIA [Halobacillus litoralis]MCA0971194.1 PTS glucose transporter subunit IIA [Halobacillus litoralis]
MFKKLFGKKETSAEVFAPVTGNKVALEEVPDPVFAQKMMGEGIAIEPTEGTVVSPVEGEIVQVFPTKHAVGLKTNSGAEILIHIGLETVSMEGEGFEAFVSQGDKVSVGDKLITFDMDLVKEKAKSTITPIIVTNSDEHDVNVTADEQLTAGSSNLMTVNQK